MRLIVHTTVEGDLILTVIHIPTEDYYVVHSIRSRNSSEEP